MAKSINRLSDERRIEHYRGLALEALANAHEALTHEQRLGFLDIAQSWTKVAEEATRWTRRAAVESLTPSVQACANSVALANGGTDSRQASLS